MLSVECLRGAAGLLGRVGVAQGRAPDDARSPLMSAAGAGAMAVPRSCSHACVGVDASGMAGCAVCLCPLERATTFTLPECGHCFHALCIASALRVSLICPLCGLDVQEHVGVQVAHTLLADSKLGIGASLAAGLLEDLKTRGRPQEDNGDEEEVSAEVTVKALRQSARKGEAGKIPSIAALLGYGEGAKARSKQPPAVRLAAVEALRELVPVFPSAWPGLPPVLGLLRGVCISDGDDEVQRLAMRALKEVGQRGEQSTLLAVGCVLQDSRSSGELRLEAADALQALAMFGDLCSMRMALLALKDPDCSVRSVGLTTLRKTCGPRGECGDFLADVAGVAFGHPETEVRASAMEIVSLVEGAGGAHGIAVATAGLQDTEEEVQHAALSTLRRLWQPGDQEAVATLADVARRGSRDARLRCVALEAMPRVAGRGSGLAAAAAAGALDSPDGAVQAAAVQALKQLHVRGDEEVVTTLLFYAEHRGGEVQKCALEALGHVATRRDAPALEALHAFWVSNGDEELQLKAEEAMRRAR